MLPELIAAFVEECPRAFNEMAADANAERGKAKRDLAKVEKKIVGILTAIEDGIYRPSMIEKMAALEVEKADLTASLPTGPSPPPSSFSSRPRSTRSAMSRREGQRQSEAHCRTQARGSPDRNRIGTPHVVGHSHCLQSRRGETVADQRKPL